MMTIRGAGASLLFKRKRYCWHARPAASAERACDLSAAPLSALLGFYESHADIAYIFNYFCSFVSTNIHIRTQCIDNYINDWRVEQALGFFECAVQ